MSSAFASPYWYRVRELRPALRGHLRIHRHHYRGERWHVLQDPATGRHHRFSPSAYFLIALMDGTRTLQGIFDAAASQLGDDCPTQAQTIQLMSQLHAADALRSDVTPDEREVFARFSKIRRQTRLTRWMSPLSLRFPLADPNAFLERWVHRVAPLFTPLGFAVWAAVVAFGVLLAGAHWDALVDTNLAAILDPSNLMLMVVAYPIMKALHELGHAFATKVWGGEVHEIGVMLLVGMPVPYVDASASWSFGDKRRRMIVSAAGVMVELFLSTLALVLWLNTSDGALHGLAWNALLIGGVSTLFFNGNPLLRFDGYYVLSDAIEIPNLAARSSSYVSYLFQHYVLGLSESRRIDGSAGERPWLVGYGVGAFVYRLIVTFGIAFMIAQRFFVIGVLLAAWGLVAQTITPAARSVLALRRDPRVPRAGLRAKLGLAGVVLSALLLLFVVPLPVWTAAEGVVWLPERAQLRAGGDGFVQRILVRPGSEVAEGTPLLALDDPLLRARLRRLEARERELRARVDAARADSIVEAGIQGEELLAARAELAREREKERERVIRSPAAGTFVLPVAENLPGRFVKRGQVLGYVASFDAPTVRTVIAQSQVGRVRESTRRVRVRLLERPGETLSARIEREVPAASSELPSVAFGAAGGGAIAVDLRDAEGLTASESFFQFDLALEPGAGVRTIGGRALVRFEHRAQPLAPLVYGVVRRAFLGKLGV